MTADLASFVAPHSTRPPAPVTVDWNAVEAWLGVELPDDYKQLASQHGPLDFGAYLWIHVPCAQQGTFDYGDWLTRTHRQARLAARQLPAHTRPPIHPEPGGLLAWGCSRGTDLLFWDTSRSVDPNKWTVVVHHAHLSPACSGLRPWHSYDLTLTEYLHQTVAQHPSPEADLLGPLAPTFARTAYLTDIEHWTPPPPRTPRLTPTEHRFALETGSGLPALSLLTPPPTSPYLGSGSWEALFTELGTTLPTEYVQLMERYGAGCWSEWLRFLTPLRRSPQRRFVSHVRDVTQCYETLAEGDTAHHPLRMWPEPGGFLPFANSVDGDQLGWLTRDRDPNTWPLVIWPRHAYQGASLEHGLVDTLLAWLRGDLHTKGLPALDPDDDPLEFATFEPWTDAAYW